MSYQVLARKWRPKSFASLVGQEHVVRALTHALSTGRLHHAWLFTGTRGVGKTTVSRILAKALNCESGVTAEPCGQCDACRAIDADRFPDYVEMDAASNRGVEDMAALLDKAVYAPVQGRYKVYMIDEVHMLTGHAFNAMLKTLEEPPEHVKFILATTDPQKIPVTVLSRCLQFNLKQMPPGHIIAHLTQILDAEQVPFEAAALRHIAKAGAGSMRDALSLLDQAIAHGAGKVEEEQVTLMLGTVGDDHLYAALDALAAGDIGAMLAVADAMQARSLSFGAALQSLASLLHRIALVQYAPAAIADEVERGRLQGYAARFDAEFLQLAYQIVIHGRDELALAPDDYAGFTMTLLRLHVFRPEQPSPLGGSGDGPGGGARSLPPSAPRAPEPAAAAQPPDIGAKPQTEPEKKLSASPLAMPSPEVSSPEGSAPEMPPDGKTPPPDAAAPQPPVPPTPAVPVASAVPATPAARERAATEPVPPWESLPEEAFAGYQDAAAYGDVATDTVYGTAGMPPPDEPVDEDAAAAAGKPFDELLQSGDWHGIQGVLQLGGMVRELAQHCEWAGLQGDELILRLSQTHRHLYDMSPDLARRLGEALTACAARPLRAVIRIGVIAGETPAQRDAAEKQMRHDAAVVALEGDPFVRELIERFDATLLEASVKPVMNASMEMGI